MNPDDGIINTNFEITLLCRITAELKMIASLTPYLVQSCNKITANTTVKMTCHISLQCLTSAQESNLIHIWLETGCPFRFGCKIVTKLVCVIMNLFLPMCYHKYRCLFSSTMSICFDFRMYSSPCSINFTTNKQKVLIC